VYSPQIKPDLVTIIYKKAQLEKKSMTDIVDTLLRPQLVEGTSDNAIYKCHSCKTEIDIVVEDDKGYCDHCESVVFVDKA
jgi:DNA-directed RNA polymerase subunit RPC12/RpoP